MELSIIVMWCMTSASQWKFPAIALVGWNQLRQGRTSLIEFKCTWYKGELRSLAHTSALDFNKRGCVRQI